MPAMSPSGPRLPRPSAVAFASSPSYTTWPAANRAPVIETFVKNRKGARQKRRGINGGAGWGPALAGGGLALLRSLAGVDGFILSCAPDGRRAF